MTLDGFYDDARQAIRAQFMGKVVRITDAATSYPEEPEWATGRVTFIEFGHFGPHGEGDALFHLADVTDAGYTDFVGDSADLVRVQDVPEDGTVAVKIHSLYTKIEVLG